MKFSSEELKRYSRNIINREIGVEGQKKLASSSVLIAGAGGLGSPAALYLAAAGVGRIGIIDGDKVDISNLQRQIIHDTQRIGINKAVSAKESIEKLNPNIKVEIYENYLDEENGYDIIKKYDLVLDCFDSFISKMILNDICVNLKKPYIHGGAAGFGGQIYTYIPDKTPCLRCITGGETPGDNGLNCINGGIAGFTVGAIGAVQAGEATKYLLGIEYTQGEYLSFDFLRNNIRKIKVKVEKKCSLCKE